MAIPQSRKDAAKTLFAQGKSKKEIARLLNIAPRTVRRILSREQDSSARSDKRVIDTELLRSLHNRCGGYVERVHELLTQQHGIDIGYSTLTRIVRENNLGRKPDKRCYHVGDIPGEEMQHDTTLYRLKIGEKIFSVVCSGLYLRYSKMRYIKFYRHFNRFKLKCFFHEALSYWGYAAGICIVDNSSLVVLHGTGSHAVIHPEILAFTKDYGFNWLAHEKGHANRKAGKERNFRTVETNFLPGRTFNDMDDLNRQALEWATVHYANRPLSKTHLIPAALFEEEKPRLIKLSSYIEPPYQQHKRVVDKYGYVAFDANYYWVPGRSTGEITLIEYSDKIQLFPKDEPTIEYVLPAYGTKNEKFVPESANTNPYQPRHIRKSCDEEEKRLRQAGEICCMYLDFIDSKDSGVKQRSRFKRELYGLMKKMAPALFSAVIERALQYHVAEIDALVRIARQMMGSTQNDLQLPEISNDYENREAYRKGRFSQERDIGEYRSLFESSEKDDKS
jgi:transposase